MKTTFKILTGLSAACMTIYTLRVLLMSNIGMPIFETMRNATIGREIYWAIPMWLMSISIILVLVAISLPTKPTLDTQPSKHFRVLTYCLAGLLLLTIISALFNMKYLSGIPYLWGTMTLRIPLLLLSVVWLCMLCKNASIGMLSKGLRISVMVASVLMTVPLILQVISGIAYLCTGHLLFLHSGAIFTWLRYFIPTILLCRYSVELYKSSK